MSPTWAAFCLQRLGMDPKTVRERILFEEELLRLPALRAACIAGHIGYSVGRIISRDAGPDTIDAAIEEARELTCLDLRRRSEARRDRKMCERGKVPMRGPASFMAFLADVVAGAQLQAVTSTGACITAGEAYARVADHFTEVWRKLVRPLAGLRGRVLTRNGGLCLVPGCSRAAEQAHHIEFESHGGPTTEWNLAGICAAHHLHCVHLGYMRIRGRADGVLVFELGLHGGRPVEVYRLEAGDVARRVPAA